MVQTYVYIISISNSIYKINIIFDKLLPYVDRNKFFTILKISKLCTFYVNLLNYLYSGHSIIFFEY